MSAFSDRIRGGKTGLFKVADLEDGKERTLTIKHLDEEVAMFGKTVDLLNFIETGQQLQINQTNAEFLLDAFGDDPEEYSGHRVTLYLADYEYDGKKGKSIRLKKAGTSTAEVIPPSARSPSPKGDRKSDLDDEIPF